MLEAGATSPVRATNRTLISPKISQAGIKKASKGLCLQSDVDMSLSQPKIEAEPALQCQNKHKVLKALGAIEEAKRREGDKVAQRVYVWLM